MCGRIAQFFTLDDLYRAYDLIQTETVCDIAPRYNIARLQTCLAVRAHEDGNHLEEALFELVPAGWSKPLKDKTFSTFNARAETLHETQSFAPLWRAGQRCVVPVSGFYEWPRPARKGQAPYYIAAADGPLLHLAALWSHWRGTDGAPRLTLAIVTTEANGLLAGIPHPRCPVALDPREIDAWLIGDTETAASLLKSPADTLMQARRVSSFVNRVGHEGEACLSAA